MLLGSCSRLQTGLYVHANGRSYIIHRKTWTLFRGLFSLKKTYGNLQIYLTVSIAYNSPQKYNLDEYFITYVGNVKNRI